MTIFNFAFAELRDFVHGQIVFSTFCTYKLTLK